MLGYDRMRLAAESPCRVCGEMCVSAIFTGDLSKVICSYCLQKEVGVHHSQSTISGVCYSCAEVCDSAIRPKTPNDIICYKCLNAQMSIYRNPAKTLHLRPDYIPEEPPKPRRLVQYATQDGQACYFYGYGLDDREKIWVDPGAIELFLTCLFWANRRGISVCRLIARIPEISDMLCSHWFVDPDRKEYILRIWVGKLQDD